QQLARSFTSRNVVMSRVCDRGLMNPVAFTYLPFQPDTSAGSFIFSVESNAPSVWNARSSASGGGFEHPGRRMRSQASRFMLVLLYGRSHKSNGLIYGSAGHKSNGCVYGPPGHKRNGTVYGWHGACCILLTMIRRRLSLQLTLVMLLVALAPLAGAAFVTLHLLEQSIAEQVQASQEELARASSALVRDYLKDATTKLKSIAQMIRPGEDTQAQSRRLNTLLDPPDIFLEVGFRRVEQGNELEVVAQVQQSDYTAAQTANKQSNRAFNSRVGQQVQKLSNDAPILQEPI